MHFNDYCMPSVCKVVLFIQGVYKKRTIPHSLSKVLCQGFRKAILEKLCEAGLQSHGKIWER